ncbi:MAG: hypothetical protein H6507_00375 [Calditrichaeota bacterium]|nr:hypothetical protein [Calditrichota bacterium]
MTTSTLNPTTKTLKQLGFRRKSDSIQHFFLPHRPIENNRKTIKPDVDYPIHDERVPQAPNFTGMWLDHWSHWGDVKNPVGSPLESGA